MSKKFPIIVVDDFYENPEKIVEYSKSLEYKKSIHGSYPGGRTEAFHNINEILFNLFCAKLFGIFYNFKYESNIKWNVVTNFYKIDKPIKSNNHTTGWIHTDEKHLLAGLVYLNKDWQNSIGTKFYKQVKLHEKNLSEFKKDYFLNKISLDEYLKVKNEHNSHYIETDSIEPVYNRMICYDTSYFHTNADITKLKTDRITQVFFVEKLKGGEHFKYPLDRIKYD
jgi:hypothetical protein